MMILHPSRGALRSYHDRQLSERRARDVARHLERCARCGARLEEIGTQARRVRELLEALEVATVPLRDVAARSSATAGLERAPFGAWGWFSRPVALPVPAWVSLGLALVLFGTIVGNRPRMAPDVQHPAPHVHQPAPERKLVVVAQQGPSGRESRTLSLNEGNYRFIETPTIYTGP